MATKESTEQLSIHQKIAQANEPRTRCLVCKFETAPKMRCICLPAADDNVIANVIENPMHAPVLEPPIKQEFHSDRKIEPELNEKEKSKKTPSSQDLSFDLSVILDLMRRNLLKIDNNSELGVLNVSCDKIHYLNPQEKNELQKFMRAVLKMHHDFLQEKNLTDKSLPLQVDKDYDKNITHIKISTLSPHLYDAFIQKLKKANILATPTYGYTSSQTGDKPSHQKEKNFHPSPFKTVPRPKGYQE